MPPARVGNAGELGVDVPQHERVRIHVTVPLEDNGSTGRKLDGIAFPRLKSRPLATCTWAAVIQENIEADK